MGGDIKQKKWRLGVEFTSLDSHYSTTGVHFSLLIDK